MKILLFFSRIALICNICFVFAHLLRYAEKLQTNDLVSTVILLGYFAVLLNIILAISLLILFFYRKGLFKTFPRWLLITNFLFLIVQLFIFLS